jgi:hypothetical protein
MTCHSEEMTPATFHVHPEMPPSWHPVHNHNKKRRHKCLETKRLIHCPTTEVSLIFPRHIVIAQPPSRLIPSVTHSSYRFASSIWGTSPGLPGIQHDTYAAGMPLAVFSSSCGGENSSHIIMGCESAELSDPEIREQLEASGLVLGFSEDRSLVVAVRGPSARAWQSTLPNPDRPTPNQLHQGENRAAKVTVLRDRTSAAFVAEAGGRLTVWWCIYDVTFGYRKDGDEPLTRSGLNKVRVWVYHVNNLAARRKPDIVRGHLAAMAIDICQLQVDIVANPQKHGSWLVYHMSTFFSTTSMMT